MIVAFFAMPEAFRLLVERRHETKAEKLAELSGSDGRQHVSLRDMINLGPSLIRGCLIGTGNGSLPGSGATIGSVLAYNFEKRMAKHPELFGKGSEEGIVAVEASNNAVVAGALVPSLALGIPGSGAIAILLGLLVGKGVVPGPLLFSEDPGYIMIVFAGLIACQRRAAAGRRCSACACSRRSPPSRPPFSGRSCSSSSWSAPIRTSRKWRTC